MAAKKDTSATRARLDNLEAGYPLKTPKGTKIGYASKPETNRYLMNLGRQPRGVSQYEANKELGEHLRRSVSGKSGAFSGGSRGSK